MTYTPIHTTEIATSFGTTKLVVNSSREVQILTSDIDGFLTINGVTYHGRLGFERPEGQNWRLRTKSNGHAEYIDGISMSRVDDWSKKLSESARRKLIATIVPEVDAFMQTGEGLALAKAADQRNDDAKLASARSAVENARESLAAAERMLAEAEAELASREEVTA